MSTPLTDRIEALTAQANAVTGASDTTLTDAVGTLISGYSADLYPIGTDIITKYIGRDGDGHPPWGKWGTPDYNTGEINIAESAASSNFSLSEDYLPIDPAYTYLKGVSYLGFILYYDEHKSYLSYSRAYSNRNWQTITDIPQAARYVRVGTHSSATYDQLAIIRIA